MIKGSPTPFPFPSAFLKGPVSPEGPLLPRASGAVPTGTGGPRVGQGPQGPGTLCFNRVPSSSAPPRPLAHPAHGETGAGGGGRGGPGCWGPRGHPEMARLEGWWRSQGQRDRQGQRSRVTQRGRAGVGGEGDPDRQTEEGGSWDDTEPGWERRGPSQE